MKVFKDVNLYQLYNDKLYYRTNDRCFYILKKNTPVTSVLKDNSEIISFTENVNYARSGYDTSGYRIVDNNLIKISLKFNEANEEGIAIGTSSRGDSLFQLPEEKQILKEWLPDAIFHVKDQYLVNDALTDFKLIDSNKGEILWTIPQPLVEKTDAYDGRTNIKKVLGIYKNGLWLQLPDRRLWKLDIQTGELLEEIENFYFSAIPEGIFLSQQGLIIIFHYTIYAEYNLETKEFTTDKEISSENELIIRNVLFNQNDNYLYFTGNKDKSFYPNVYGIFNRKTLTFDFIGGSINETSYFYQTPQVNHELFTILDSEGNLIIHKIKDIL